MQVLSVLVAAGSKESWKFKIKKKKKKQKEQEKWVDKSWF